MKISLSLLFKAQHSGVWSEIHAPLGFFIRFFFFFSAPASKPAANSDDDEAETCFHYCSRQPTELLVVVFFCPLNAENVIPGSLDVSVSFL